MNNLKAVVELSNQIPRAAPITDDFNHACVWASVGLVPLGILLGADMDTDLRHSQSETW